MPLTRHDVSDPAVAKDAQHALRRCSTEAQYASWAAEWGEALTVHAIATAAARGGEPMPIEERLL